MSFIKVKTFIIGLIKTKEIILNKIHLMKRPKEKQTGK